MTYPYAQKTAETLIRRGFVLRPTVDPERYPQRAKAPGDDQCRPVKWTAGEHLARALTEDQIGRYERFSVIVGSHDNPTRWIDVETDPPEGEALLASRVSIPDYGPIMVTESGSIHRLLEPIPAPDGRKLRRGRWAFDHQPGVDIPWHFVAIDGEKRVWRGLNDPCPIIGEPLWKPEKKRLDKGARDLVVTESPAPPPWIPLRMQQARNQPFTGSGKHTRTRDLVKAGWIFAGMSRDAIWRIVANDQTCLAWVADGRSLAKLRDDVQGQLDYFGWSLGEDKYRHWIEEGRSRGTVSCADTYTRFGRRSAAVDRAERRARDEGRLHCIMKGTTGGAGRPAKAFGFYSPATHSCPCGAKRWGSPE